MFHVKVTIPLHIHYFVLNDFWRLMIIKLFKNNVINENAEFVKLVIFIQQISTKLFMILFCSVPVSTGSRFHCRLLLFARQHWFATRWSIITCVLYRPINKIWPHMTAKCEHNIWTQNSYIFPSPLQAQLADFVTDKDSTVCHGGDLLCFIGHWKCNVYQGD